MHQWGGTRYSLQFTSGGVLGTAHSAPVGGVLGTAHNAPVGKDSDTADIHYLLFQQLLCSVHCSQHKNISGANLGPDNSLEPNAQKT